MTTTTLPKNENFRLEALRSLGILNTAPEKKFDELTELANFICDTQIALISLIDSDRQWFKSKNGTKACGADRENSLCSHAILKPKTALVINDTRLDKRFNTREIKIGKTPIIFYAGIPLVNEDGFAIGTLCVVDDKARELTRKQLNSLESLAKQVILLIELNKKNIDLLEIQQNLKKKNESLREYARIISHDLKMPLANIITSTDILKLKLKENLDSESLEYFDYIKSSSFTMNDYIGDILDHYENETISNADYEKFNLNNLLIEIVELLDVKSKIEVDYPINEPIIRSNKLILKQIFFNLIGNSVKYTDKDQIEISINASEDDQFYYFKILDNGKGIPKDKLDVIFELFETAGITDKNGKQGNGIGLFTVKKHIETLGGNIDVSSIVGVQTVFEFSIKK